MLIALREPPDSSEHGDVRRLVMGAGGQISYEEFVAQLRNLLKSRPNIAFGDEEVLRLGLIDQALELENDIVSLLHRVLPFRAA